MTEFFQIRTTDLITREWTMTGGQWSSAVALTSHVPGAAAPVPEPASMVLVATGLIATAIRQRAGRKTLRRSVA